MWTLILSLLAFNVLVFIHEFGHFFVAKSIGMKVEAFRIGFGPVLFSRVWKDTLFELSAIPFTGYVKISDQEPLEAERRFSPFQKILVALGGPVMNLLFAFLGFSLLYFVGGRIENYSSTNSIVGSVQPGSILDEKGVRAGDWLFRCNGEPLLDRKSLLYQLILDKEKLHFEAQRLSSLPETDLFSFSFIKEEGQSIGLSSTARYLIYDPSRIQGEVLSPQSPFRSVPLEQGSRLIWANGSLLFSLEQLLSLLQEESVLVTLIREGKKEHVRVPIYPIKGLTLSSQERGWVEDLLYESQLLPPFSQAKLFPYSIHKLVIQAPFAHFKDHKQLLPKDQIIAINGERVQTEGDLIDRIQERKILLVSAKKEAQHEQTPFYFSELPALLNQIGEKEPQEMGGLQLLAPVVPFFDEELQLRRLGVLFVDKQIEVNPSPWSLMVEASQEFYRVLKDLAQGQLSPKYMTGGVMALGVVYKSLSESFRETLYWVSLISFNLGFVNLLPIPVLDGGYLIFYLWEMITRRRLSEKMLQAILTPFFILLLGSFIFTTLQDLMKVKHFFF